MLFFQLDLCHLSFVSEMFPIMKLDGERDLLVKLSLHSIDEGKR